MNALTPQPSQSVGFALIPTNIREAMDLATMMSKGRLVPKDLQQSPSDCLLVIEQATRWGMSPFAVAQEVSVIQGKLMHSGKIVAAAVQSCGLLQGRLRYDYAGEGNDRVVTVSGLIRGEAAPCEVSVRLADARTKNDHWGRSPDQMLAYHGARVWARRFLPEVMLGVYSPEEFDPQATPAAQSLPPAKGPTMDHVPQPMGEPLGDAGTREDWPRLTADSQLVNARDEREWLRGVQGTVGRLESSAAVNAWRQEMGPLLGSISERSGGAVRLAEEIISERLDQLAVQGEDA